MLVETTRFPVNIMAEPQEDEEQWLYGDDKDESKEEGEINDKNEGEGNKDKSKTGETPMDQDDLGDDKEGDATQESSEKGEGEEGDKEKSKKQDDEGKDKDKDGDESSSDDDVTITIGDIKKGTDVIQQTHQSRFQPKAPVTSGLKDDDFNGPGKVNGVHIADFNIAELEEKPWRKPGADISDYFNYGFNEETWFKYCERQKRMRVHESGAGLAGLGISVTKPFGNTASNIPVAIVNDNSKYNAGLPTVGSRAKAGPPPRSKAPGAIDVIGGNQSKGNTIQVMTADRREYSNKTIMNPSPGPGYDDMDFGGNPYGETYYPPENNSYYNPYESPGGQWSGGPPPPPPPVSGGNSGGPPNWEGNAPVVSVSSAYFEEDSMGAPPSVEQEEERHSRPRRSHRSRSRSPSRRHHRRHSRSRSRSPSHRHKRKKSKRERDAD